MKKTIFTLLIMLCAVPMSLVAQKRVVRITRYEEKAIYGIEASNAFQVEIIQSPYTKLVVEIDEELEKYLKVSLDKTGNVHLSLTGGSSNGKKKSIRKATLYVNELKHIKGTGAVTFTTKGTFGSNKTAIYLYGASRLNSLSLNTGSLFVRMQGATKASVEGSTGDLKTEISGASDLKLSLSAANTNFECSGASKITVTGEAAQARYNVSGSSNITADGFAVEAVTVKASGASKVRVWAKSQLTAEASSASSVLYKGKPDRYNNKTSSAASIRKLD